MKEIKIVITMAGVSKRFSDAGFSVPKYMLEIGHNTVFEYAISSFKKYFLSNHFIFICRPLYHTEDFIKAKCKKLGISSYAISILNEPTKGQGETVIKGLENLKISDFDSILIFNIDTFRKDFCFPQEILNWDGYLEVFKGSGENWSYVKSENEFSTRVIRTAEKEQISELCSTGLYYFKEFKFFKIAFNSYYKDNYKIEQYIAPIYNQLIYLNKNIHFHLIEREEVIFCGIPEEYNMLCSKSDTLFL